MPLSPEFRERTTSLLDTAPPDATIVVASAGPDGHLLMQTALPTPQALVHIAHTLLSQASDELDNRDDDAAIMLAERIERALAELPGADAEDAG